MSLQDCYRICGDRSGLVLKTIGFRYSNVLLDKRSAIERAVRLDIKFAYNYSRGSFGRSRYSDGTWPVLYTATEDETSIHEIAYHARREWIFGLPAGTIAPIYKKSRKLLYVVQVKRHKQKTESMSNGNLVADDYRFCHSIAASAKASGFVSLVVPSARRMYGVCIPVFERSMIMAKASTSIPFTLRWYPSSDKLVHYATPKRGGSNINLWHA